MRAQGEAISKRTAGAKPPGPSLRCKCVQTICCPICPNCWMGIANRAAFATAPCPCHLDPCHRAGACLHEVTLRPSVQTARSCCLRCNAHEAWNSAQLHSLHKGVQQMGATATQQMRPFEQLKCGLRLVANGGSSGEERRGEGGSGVGGNRGVCHMSAA